MSLNKLISKLKSIMRLLLINFLLFSIPLNVNANGTFYTAAWDADYSNMWVGQPSNSTMFAPTIEVFFDTALSYAGFKGSITLGTTGNNCGYIGYTRFCARLADINSHGNTFSCDSAGDSCIESSTTSCGSVCPNGVGTSYSCSGQAYGNKSATYTCQSGGYYNCDCPECRNVCAIRVCAYQDPSSNESFTENCDDVYDCMDGTGSNAYMPYFENDVVAFKNIFGENEYYNTDGGTFIGCIDVPIGPYPPPYCDPIIGQIPAVSTANICENSPQYEYTGDSTAYYQESLSTAVCELSTAAGIPTSAKSSSTAVYNTFEEPIVRLYFANPLNICSSTYVVPNPPPTPGNDTCVQIQLSNLTPSGIWQGNEGLLPVCSTAPGASQTNCVKFPSGRTTGPSGSSTQLGSDYPYFMAYFNEPSSSSPTTILPYGADIASQLSLYGINDALYDDIGDQKGDSGGSYSYNNTFITKNYGTISLYDYEGNNRTYGAFIDLGFDPYTQLATNSSGDGSQLCVDEISGTDGSVTPVTCVDRPWMFPPTVSSCLTYSTCDYASTVNIPQQPRISVNVGRSFVNTKGQQVNPVNGIIGVNTTTAANTSPTPFCVIDDNHSTAQQTPNSSNCPSSPCNLASCTIDQANLFSAYITDNINYSITYDPSATNGTKTPYSSGQQYTSGMQYYDNAYCRGATQICLSGYSNPLKTVVTKMVPIVTGDTTTYQPSTILTDRIIPPYQPGETYPLQDSTLYNSATNNYYSTSSGSTTVATYIGYYNDTAGTYIQGQGCTTTPGMTCCAVEQGSSTCTAASSIVYPSDVLCTCTSSTGDTYTCNQQQCSTAYQVTTTTTINGNTETVTTTVSGETPTTTTTTASGTNTGTLTGYQIAGNQLNDAVTNNDNMQSPWPNCSYNQSSNTTICPATSSDGTPLFGIRELTPMELGLCVPLLMPYCNAISSSQGFDYNDGYASWPQTAAGTTATGACISPATQASAGPPTRNCAYQDTTSNGQPVLYPNGCPEYTQVWQTVTNPCVVAPPWWPGNFLAGNTNFLGAIINQFSVALNYRAAVSADKYLTPLSSNTDPLSLFKAGSKPVIPEPWNTNTSPYSCTRNGKGTATRTYTDGDQEMLYLTTNQWSDLWANYSFEWLLADQNTNNGCAVYSLCTAFDSSGNCTAANINASFVGITPAMKVCKYQDNVSFALVDLGTYNSSTNSYQYTKDYTNVQYLMQSNTVAYNAYISVGSSYQYSDSNYSFTYLENNVDSSSVYDTRINNGIVVYRLGTGFNFTSANYDNNGQPPAWFSSITTPESVVVGYGFSHYYEGHHTYCSDEWGGTCWGTSKRYTFGNSFNPPDKTYGTCYTSNNTSGTSEDYLNNEYYLTQYPMSIFSTNLDITQPYKPSAYLAYATNYSNYSSYYESANFTTIYIPQCYSDSSNNDNSCGLNVLIYSYTPGNSAANSAMFYWSSPTNYNVTNGPVVPYNANNPSGTVQLGVDGGPPYSSSSPATTTMSTTP